MKSKERFGLEDNLDQFHGFSIYFSTTSKVIFGLDDSIPKSKPIDSQNCKRCSANKFCSSIILSNIKLFLYHVVPDVVEVVDIVKTPFANVTGLSRTVVQVCIKGILPLIRENY